ncbi:sulfite reductase [NADPH] flavoprotein alpha-component CysJ [Gordonia polyisoprenivorans VH2]|uniref:assimilatory sulfite reductase (NADPH) n=1 Tax=Gordonia polyisoprenivorans (strain DSM 44266 / VH2) TaxID=1112204 RepID=H6N3S1_GORPV|nr:sulfite reductase flavoprotein subunit alpha [Gordonia polyisoprenivorans]AFA73542.1 sulfite reductase [NADPH] flavoprotein alpha-component CysJ [Gordonia polyisoprenivorans VH2]
MQYRVAYGSETGNAQSVAERLTALATSSGLEVTCSRLNDADPVLLAGETTLLIVISTTDDGDIPYNAAGFWSAITAESAPEFDHASYAVLALGDSDYLDFCQAGIDLDRRLAELGGTRLCSIVTCDADFEADAERWTREVLDLIVESPTVAPITDSAVSLASAGRDEEQHLAHHADIPFSVVQKYRLSGPGSAKPVWHLCLDVSDSGVIYSPGDCVRVLPGNDADYVDQLLAAPVASSDFAVDVAAVRADLMNRFEIRRPSRELISEVTARTSDESVKRVLSGDDRRALHSFLWDRDVLDLVRLADRRPFHLGEIVDTLRPLATRSYSISSSQLRTPDRLEITVAALEYNARGRDRHGVCSSYLTNQITADRTVWGAIDVNPAFHLPDDDDTAVIMVGPGTGIAPFRGFLYERQARKARGRNWLFFGARTSTHDHLYADELKAFECERLLTRLDVAFSREGGGRRYVQHLMWENGKELFRWLSEGAYIYVCGDATAMARDVDRTLREIVVEHGVLPPEAAASYVDGLSREGRYLRDVY